MAGQVFEFISTTADMGFITWADDLPQLFARAAAALFTIITNPQEVTPEHPIQIQVKAPNWPDLVVNWLSEILYQQEVRGMLFAKAEIEQIQPHSLQASLWGEPYNPSRHIIKREVKAITYHQLSLKQDKQGQWRLRVIIDI